MRAYITSLLLPFLFVSSVPSSVRGHNEERNSAKKKKNRSEDVPLNLPCCERSVRMWVW